jgi:hypothetical protein
MQWPLNRCFLAHNAHSIPMRVPIGQQLFLALAAHECALGARLHFVHFQVVEALDVPDEVVFLLGVGGGAGQVVAVVVLATVCVDSVTRGLFGQGCDYYSVTGTYCYLLDYEVVEELYFLRLPELRLELILISISDTASTEGIETPLVKFACISKSSSMILVHIHIYEFNLCSIIG